MNLDLITIILGGYGFLISIAISVIGLTRAFFVFFLMTKPVSMKNTLSISAEPEDSIRKKSFGEYMLFQFYKVFGNKSELYKFKEIIFFAVIVFFHVLIIVTPFFVDAHQILLRDSINVSLWSLPDSIIDFLTIIIVFFILLLFLRRLFSSHVRILSEIKDYFLLFIVALPFITGFLCYHQIGNYNYMMLFHLFSSNMLIIIIGWSKLNHMIFIIFGRFLIANDFSYLKGSRQWR